LDESIDDERRRQI
jgi:hypothetical protein